VSEKKELLLELGCEEIPATFVLPALDRMKELFAAFCDEKRISFGEVETYATPRRLTLVARDVSDRQSDMVTEVKGPPAKVAVGDSGGWTKAAEKFAASRGLKTSKLEVRPTEKGDYVFARIEEKGGKADAALRELPRHIVEKLSFPKNMKWDVRKVRFARPVRWILFLFGGRALKAGFEGIPCGRYTFGNRWFGKKKIKVDGVDDYFEKLEAAGVMADHRRRREAIEAGVRDAAGGKPHITGKLLEEVTFLVEHPYISVGGFPGEFTELPPEVLITCIEKNQYYFPVMDPDTGRLYPRFVNVMNVPLADSKVALRGFEKVLLSRLKDAKFFYDEDVKKPLPEWVGMLGRMTFQQQLGSLLDKTERVRKLAGSLCEKFGLDTGQAKTAERAAHLMKADLNTQMVFEYGELQGTVGKYYALHAGETEAVAEAIEEHYMPRAADAALPSSPAGAALAVADKIDTITGYFSVGLAPTGSADPYQLRRHALGIIRIMDASGFSIPLPELIEDSLSRYSPEIIPGESREKLADEILDFLRVRFAGFMESEGYDYDVVNALDLRRAQGIPEARKQADALAAERGTSEFSELHEVFTRISNIQKKSASSDDFKRAVADPGAFAVEAEKQLYSAYEKLEKKWSGCSTGYEEKLKDLYSLTAPAHNFFESVLVMDEDPNVRSNRLALLKQLRELYLEVADFQEIVMGRD